MSSSPADNARPGLARSDQVPAVEETASFRHGLTPREPGGELTQALHGKLPADELVATPQCIGRYRVQRLLGQGTFGRVWLATDDELQRRVAIKVLFPARLADLADAEAWLAEARILAALDHPHIVPVYDVGRTEDGCAYAVSKFIPGKTLQQEIKDGQGAGMERAAAVSIIATLAEALHHAHERQLIHRDVKPANVLLEEPSGRVYLADFGLATGPDERAVVMAGTPAYMSPEQARGEAVDSRSDLYALGIIFYELLSGRRPFGGGSVHELLQNVRIGLLPPLTEMDPSFDRNGSVHSCGAGSHLP